MELLDGYIVGIYNYCDRWCETCPFTSRCRVFATSVELDAAADPALAAIGAGVMRSTAAMVEALRTAASYAAALDDEDEDADDEVEAPRGQIQPVVPAAHQALRDRAMTYAVRTATWLTSHDPATRSRPDDAFGVVAWFHHLIAAKVDRALHGLSNATIGIAEDLSDAEGSAKVAVLGAERSRAAWVDLADQGRVEATEAASFIEALTAIIDDLDALVPRARAFVRPGFDEPDQLARVLAEER